MEFVSIHLRLFILWLIVSIFVYGIFRLLHLIYNYNRHWTKQLTWNSYKFYFSRFNVFYIILISYPLGEFIYFSAQFLIWLFPELQ